MYSNESTKYADFEWAVKLNRLILNIIGLWPNAQQKACDRFLSDLRAAISLILLLFLGTVPLLHAFVYIWGDMLATLDNLQVILPFLISILKMVVVWRKKRDLTLLVDMMANDWLKAKTVKESYVMIKHAQTARVITIFGYSIMTLGFILVVLLPCFGKSLRYITNITDPIRPLPLPSYYIYDKDSSPYFELTFIGQGIIALICVMTYTGVDNFMGLLVFHLCGQMENLRGRLVNMEECKDVNSIACIVKDHIRLIRCFDIIESAFTLLLLGLLLYFAILFCFYGFLIVQVITGKDEVSFMRLMYLMSGVLSISGHMCLYCAVGEILVAQCEGISHAAYNYKWYRLEPNEARDLILIMIRANRPLYITAGKMFPMTMSTFCNLLKTSAGYVSVLLAKQG